MVTCNNFHTILAFLSLRIVFVLANIEESGEMQHFVSLWSCLSVYRFGGGRGVLVLKWLNVCYFYHMKTHLLVIYITPCNKIDKPLVVYIFSNVTQ